MTIARDRDQRNSDSWFPPNQPIAVPQPDPATAPHPWEDWDDWIPPADYTPASSTGSHTLPALPAPSAPVEHEAPGRRRHREPPQRERTSARPVLLTLLALAVVGGVAGGGWYLLRPHHDPLQTGSCLRDLSTTPHPVSCSSPESQYLIIDELHDATDPAVCNSLTTGKVPVEVAGTRTLLCVLKHTQ